MLLDVQQYDGLPVPTNDGYSAGIKIAVHDPEDPQYIMSQKGFLIPGGAESLLQINHQKVAKNFFTLIKLK